MLSSLLLAGFLGAGVYGWVEVKPLVSPEYRNVAYTVPASPTLTAAGGETVYRIDPTRSKASYAVNETFVGASLHRATGTTQGIAGDIALNPSSPSTSRVGRIVVNLEELHSDNSLRDARLRAAFLESHANPLATFDATSLDALPATIRPQVPVEFTMSGNLTVKGVAAPVVWKVDGLLANGSFTATATTTIKLSTFGVGPISIVGLVKTEDDATLTLHLTARDPSRFTIPREISPPSDTNRSGDGPSFARSIRPVIEQHCASCHTAGQVGAAHWQIATASDVSKTASAVALVTTARYMPPWPASDKGVPLAHNRSLDGKTIKLLSDWAAAGGPLDVDGGTKIRTPKSAGPQVRHDLTLQMPEGYAGSADHPNDYRCFVLDPKLTAPTYVTGYAFAPDQIQEIHHGQVFHLPAAARAEADALAGQDGKPGWECYTGPAIGVPGGRRGGRSELIAGWAPGQDPVAFHDAGILLQPGDFVVLQVHYHYDKPPTLDRSTLFLQTDPGTADLAQIHVVNPLAPVEIPCSPGQTAPLCDRAASVAQSVVEYGPSGQFIEEGLLQGCRKSAAEVAASFDGTVASSSCDSRIPANGSIIGVMGHMHTLGKSFRMTLDPGTPDEKVLLDIPTWNFDWQLQYELATPVTVHRGETVRISCSWDRSLEPNRPPKYITFAEGTEDEMCFNTYSLVPDRGQVPAPPPGG